jgi:hypothetical protein
MTTHTLYDGLAGTSRLRITARPTVTASTLKPARWIVQFDRWSQNRQQLDQCAQWMPTLNTWDKKYWHPIGSRLIPSEVLGDVVEWLWGRPVGEVEDTTTKEAT